jgi:hypothetical protein
MPASTRRIVSVLRKSLRATKCSMSK